MTQRDFEIIYRKPSPKDEQETIITYDKLLDTWYLYTNTPKHARKWEDAITPSTEYRSCKVYHEETGELIEIEGAINGSASIRKKRSYSPEEKQAIKDRLQKARIQ